MIDAFVEAYRERGRPRIVMFWNRALTDQLVEQRKTQKVKRREGGGTETAESQQDGAGGEVKLTERQNAETVTEHTDETAVDRGRRAGPAESFDWALEDAVVRALTGVGANLVDRSAAMRFADAEKAVQVERPDALRVEADALLQKGDLLLEVLNAPDPKAPSGLLYRLLVKEVGTGRVLASHVTDAKPKVRPPLRRLRFGDQGLEPVAAAQPSVGEVARELGKPVMRTLAVALGR